MAPTTPLKRHSPSDSSEGTLDGHTLKKRRTDTNLLQTPPAELLETRLGNGYSKADDVEGLHGEILPSENAEMDLTLKRSIAIALKHVGFESSSKEALESFLVLTERCENTSCRFQITFANTMQMCPR